MELGESPARQVEGASKPIGATYEGGELCLETRLDGINDIDRIGF